MNSFTFLANGILVRNPVLVSIDGVPRTDFCLVGSDNILADDDGPAREAVTTVCFIAFHDLAKRIADQAHKGDQLIIEACVHCEHVTRPERVCHVSFIVQSVVIIHK